MTKNKLGICLWYDGQAEEAVKLYTSLFPDSKIKSIARYTSEGKEIHGQEEGKVMTIDFELNGNDFVALNGGPMFKFTEAMSIIVECDSQEEIDFYWEKLTENGGEESYCGWLKDKFGVSWQIIPSVLNEMMNSNDQEKARKVSAAFLQMRKFDIAKLEEAYRS